jgi:hypothetical protein
MKRIRLPRFRRDDNYFFRLFYGKTKNKEILLKRIIGRNIELALEAGVPGQKMKSKGLRWLAIGYKKMITEHLKQAGILPLK